MRMRRVEILHRPGSDLGPCRGPCTHTDCLLAKRAARSVCRLCRTPIGFGRALCDDPACSAWPTLRPVIPRYVHARCLRRSLRSGTESAYRALRAGVAALAKRLCAVGEFGHADAVDDLIQRADRVQAGLPAHLAEPGEIPE